MNKIIYSDNYRGITSQGSYFAFGFYLLLSLIKMHSYAIDGRFWAEEGSVFFTAIENLNFFDGVLFPFNGHIELMTNIVVMISTLVDFKYAPLVTTWLSFMLQSIPVLTIIMYRKYIGISTLGIFAFITILVGLPQAAEVWANSINLHFHFTFLAILILVISIEHKQPTKNFRWLLAASGLSGIPANFTTPIFFMVAHKTKEKEHLIYSFIMLSTSAIQLLFLLTQHFDIGHRELGVNFPLCWFSTISQQLFSPLLGTHLTNKISTILRFGLINHDSKILLLSLTLMLPYLAWGYIASKRNSLKLIVLLSAMIVIQCLSIVTSIGSTNEKVGLIHSTNGGRYFFPPNLLTVTALLIFFNEFKKNYLTFGLVFALTFSALFRVGSHIGGPAWIIEYDRSSTHKLETVNIWPSGWKMKFPR